MPYLIEKQGEEWVIKKKDGGQIVGHSKSKKDAEASVRARLAGEFGMKEAKFIPPESGDAPTAVKAILSAVYSEMRSKWAEEHPEDIENDGNKTSASQQAWGAVKNAGWEKNTKGEWKLKEERWDPISESWKNKYYR